MQQHVEFIDRLKAVSTVGVVLIHCLPPFFEKQYQWEQSLATWLSFSTKFFVYCSGYLFAQTRQAPWKRVKSSLIRIHLPYLVATCFAWIFRLATRVPNDVPETLSEALSDVALGNAYGPYYFPIMLSLLTAMSPLLARLSHENKHLGIYFVFVLSFILQFWEHGALDAGFASVLWPFRVENAMFWRIRSPCWWGGYYVFGWICSTRRKLQKDTHQETTTSVGMKGTRISLLMMSYLLLHFAKGRLGIIANQVFSYTVLEAVPRLLADISLPDLLNTAVLWLSINSYTVYLYHLPFVYGFETVFKHKSTGFNDSHVYQEALPPYPSCYYAMLLTMQWMLGLGGATLVARIAPRLLGDRAASRLFGCRSLSTPGGRDDNTVEDVQGKESSVLPIQARV